MGDIFLYAEIMQVEQGSKPKHYGKRRDETRWYDLDCKGLAYRLLEIATGIDSGEIAIRTLCVGFAEDYNAMVPVRAKQTPGYPEGCAMIDFTAAIQAGLESGELVLDPCYFGDKLQSVAVVLREQLDRPRLGDSERFRLTVRRDVAVAELGRIQKQREEDDEEGGA